MRLVRPMRTVYMMRRAESCPLVTWRPTGCGLASTSQEQARHRAYFSTFRNIHMRLYALKIAGKHQEAAEMAAEYNQRMEDAIPCLCGCGQKPVF